MKKILSSSFISLIIFIFSSSIIQAGDCNIYPRSLTSKTTFKVKCSGLSPLRVYRIGTKLISPSNSNHINVEYSIQTDDKGILEKELSPLEKGEYELNYQRMDLNIIIPVLKFTVTDPSESEVIINQTQPTIAITCDGGTGVNTALGCVKTDPEQFVGWFLGLAISIGGGIAFLLILWGAFQIITSSGVPEKLTSGREIIVSAISGLLMIVFSILILELIGVDILQIPGFGK